MCSPTVRSLPKMIRWWSGSMAVPAVHRCWDFCKSTVLTLWRMTLMCLCRTLGHGTRKPMFSTSRAQLVWGTQLATTHGPALSLMALLLWTISTPCLLSIRSSQSFCLISCISLASPMPGCMFHIWHGEFTSTICGSQRVALCVQLLSKFKTTNHACRVSYKLILSIPS